MRTSAPNTYGVAFWHEGGRKRAPQGSASKMDAEASRQKARAMKAIGC